MYGSYYIKVYNCIYDHNLIFLQKKLGYFVNMVKGYSEK